jgi:hypothetical protein
MRPAILGFFAASLLLVFATTDATMANDVGGTTANTKPTVRRHHRTAQHPPRHAPRPRITVSGTRWAAVAASSLNGGVATGVSWGKSTATLASSGALARCRAMGRPGCYVTVGPVTGCLYVSISRSGPDRSAWGTSSTPASARSNCESRGVWCLPAQGGC